MTASDLKEVWVITVGGNLVPPDQDGQFGFLGYSSRAEAEQSLQVQVELGYLDLGEGEVVRLSLFPEPFPLTKKITQGV